MPRQNGARRPTRKQRSNPVRSQPKEHAKRMKARLAELDAYYVSEVKRVRKAIGELGKKHRPKPPAGD